MVPGTFSISAMFRLLDINLASLRPQAWSWDDTGPCFQTLRSTEAVYEVSCDRSEGEQEGGQK